MFHNIYKPFASFFLIINILHQRRDNIFIHVTNMVFKNRPTSCGPQLLLIHKQLE